MEIQFPDGTRLRTASIRVRLLARGALVVLAVVVLFSAWFTIEPEEAGLVLRFGLYFSFA